MALDMVNMIKNAEQDSLNLESEAQFEAQRYIKSSAEADRTEASNKIELQKIESQKELGAARLKAEQITAEAQKTAQAEADNLLKLAEAKKREVVNTIIEKVLK